MKRALTAALLLFVGLTMTTAAQAYVTIRLQNGNNLRWDSTTVDWTIETGGMPGMDSSTFQGALEAAFQSWEDVDCSTISFDYKGFKTWDSDTGIHVYVQTSNWDPSVGDALAYALPDPTWQGEIQSVDIVFNAVDVQWTTSMDPGYGYQDVQGVVTHEIGHSIGLDHPRYPDSTMFFSGGSSHLRSLEDDDQRGACFLYPASYFDDGIACDACDESDNCATGYCLGWGGNEAFCGENCSSDSDCASGFHCQEINDDIPDQCIPDNGYCHDAGANIPNGDFCYGHQTCEGGVCLVMSEEIYCSQTCTGWCPEGMACTNGVCLKAGDKPYGALCDEASECVTGMCINFTLSYGTCTLPCGANGGTCPNGNQCYFDSICVPPGTSLNGQPCYTPIQCQGTYCIEGSCTQPCASTATCPAGTTCVAGYCDGVVAGGSCQNPNDCASGLTCQKDTNSGPGECHRSCEPLADTGCLEDEACQWRYEKWAQYITGRCMPKNYGASEGQACNASTPCEENLICHVGQGTVETCHRDCKLFANNLGCTLGQTCDSLGDSADPKHGICTSFGSTPTDPNPPTPDAGAEPTPDAGAPNADSSSTPVADAGVGPEPDSGTATPDDDTSATTTPETGTPTDPTDDPEANAPNGTETGETGGVTDGDEPSTSPGDGDTSDGGCQGGETGPLWWFGLLPMAWLRRRQLIAVEP
jgi:hypothetical protein